MFNDNFSEQNKVLDNAVLDIQRNVFRTKESLVQISNISRIWVGKVIGKPYSIFYFILVLAGLLFFASSIPFLMVVGLGCMGIGGYFIYEVYKFNKENKYALHIEMNSGGRFILTADNMDFLNKAASHVTHTINEYGLEGKQVNNYHIDFSNQTIKNESGVVNTGSVGGDISNEK
ncbi:DUF6232 family protein [Desulfofalx alkaliphila]|uniref:DUF6232 family protein n=1 Tax=Desulfofalx alkaliphila TaxID=105483 RepID=UPI0004E0EBBC|nr:DUF6232 family protein [Desulfofalx alkaliphila]